MFHFPSCQSPGHPAVPSAQPPACTLPFPACTDGRAQQPPAAGGEAEAEAEGQQGGPRCTV